MKKSLLFLLLFMFTTSSVHASEYGAWTLKDENMKEDSEIEYRYRFYKEIKDGEYLSNNDEKVKEYSYKDNNDLEYSSYSEWLDECLVDEDIYQVEYSLVNIYQKVLPTHFIMIDQIDSDVKLLDLKVYQNNEEVSYTFLPCANCIINKDQSLVGKIIKIQLDKIIENDNLKVDILFSEEVNYKLKTSYDANFNNVSLEKIVNGKDNKLIFDKTWLDKATYGSEYYTIDNEDSDFVKNLGTTNKCHYRAIKPFYYNVVRVYYDDNYYTNVDGYIKDNSDYKVYYRNKINNNVDLLNSNLPSNKSPVISSLKANSEATNDAKNKMDNKNVKIDNNINNDSLKKSSDINKNDNELVNTLNISKNETIIKYIILIVIGLTIIYIIYVNSYNRKKCR